VASFNWHFLIFSQTLEFHSTMSTANEPADPIAKGLIPSLKQNLKDLVIWKQRVLVTNDYGEEHVEWQQPTPLQNPFKLFAQLSARDVSFCNTIYPSAMETILTPTSGFSSPAVSSHGQPTPLISMLYPSKQSNSQPTTNKTTPTSPLPSH
jgi:hypothetical protein